MKIRINSIEQLYLCWMENQNIQYRKLRNPKMVKTGRAMTSLYPDKISERKTTNGASKNKQFSIMTQNVSRYQHMIKHPHMKENYINWIVKLREPIQANKKESQNQQYTPSVPAVYNKSTQSRQNFLKTRNLSQCRSFNSADFFDVISRKSCKKHLQQTNLQYITNLRSQSKLSSPSKQKFCNIPSKDRNQFPSFLAKNAIKKLKSITKNQKQSAFDGSQNFPPYLSKINTEKNYGLLSIFTKCQNKASMPTLVWQMGLRS